jgi:rhodanese-related sulfurtransferase
MIKKIMLLISLLVLILIVGCSNNQGTTSSIVQKVSPVEFKDIISDENVFVLDVHVPEQEHIEGTDELIPFDALNEFVDKLPEDKNTPIALYCRSGSMSEIASKELAKMGYTEIYDLEGGRNAYIKEFGE